MVSLFEHWEVKGHTCSVALKCKRLCVSQFAGSNISLVPEHQQALSLYDALNSVSTHGEKRTWGQASQINLMYPGVNYPDQPKSVPDSHLSDPLTYWWGVTLCPPELNDVALAENVVILMRIAAMREMRLSEEVNKPSFADVLEFGGLRMECCRGVYST